MACGSKILLLRERHNMTQQDLAKKLKISRAALSHYENNRRHPSSSVLLHLAELFDVSIRYLLEDENVPSPQRLPESESLEQEAPAPTVHESERMPIVFFRHTVNPCRFL
ncbi:helix-turn-helix domain-containing protein [Paenibacillus thermoaerophilus]|uniref:Helix-turn-helix domain-containing protein n=1 Tax=Paenibacillus thermoaerophilus TaxID=1215385 RepID=A0ABW2V483_9BACL|nr:helix-turn-helix transcriptional regulator [Paenibacillus thermoaerophilus]TMV16153.1 helix-turn-helix transcriptional regulator [Paenibacillus thermoaerophilus]